MWVARDEDYTLHLFISVKPIRNIDKWVSISNSSIEINESYFPNLSWQNEPIEVSIIETFKLQSLKAIK